MQVTVKEYVAPSAEVPLDAEGIIAYKTAGSSTTQVATTGDSPGSHVCKATTVAVELSGTTAFFFNSSGFTQAIPASARYVPAGAKVLLRMPQERSLSFSPA